MGGPENGNFFLLYVVKMSLRRWVGGSKKPKSPLRNIKMAPYLFYNAYFSILGPDVLDEYYQQNAADKLTLSQSEGGRLCQPHRLCLT